MPINYSEISPLVLASLLNDEKNFRIVSHLEESYQSDVPPIFIRLLEGIYKDWIISFENYSATSENSARFSFCIHRTPKHISEEFITESYSDLSNILTEIFKEFLVKANP